MAWRYVCVRYCKWCCPKSILVIACVHIFQLGMRSPLHWTLPSVLYYFSPNPPVLPLSFPLYILFQTCTFFPLSTVLSMLLQATVSFCCRLSIVFMLLLQTCYYGLLYPCRCRLLYPCCCYRHATSYGLLYPCRCWLLYPCCCYSHATTGCCIHVAVGCCIDVAACCCIHAAAGYYTMLLHAVVYLYPISTNKHSHLALCNLQLYPCSWGLYKPYPYPCKYSYSCCYPSCCWLLHAVCSWWYRQPIPVTGARLL